MMLPPLSPGESLALRIENDARNVRALGLPNILHDPDSRARVIADCAKRLFDARVVDRALGGRELERRAESNLRAALIGWRE